MTRESRISHYGRPLLGAGILCLSMLLSACGGDDNGPPGNGNNGNNGTTPGGGTAPAACATAHCAPAP
ncbi:hypothetical protein [Cupriavidus plantarum]|uniref:Lipoprotein n=1 Tax=Cupriavidus plantarum TaxID=942865 RepID=A0A316EMZ1_9BURK|nr:hypothetical protein [Cupriavidus plantarum]NYI02456.1 hypothetical protein [Cupriavidus plantarum]PWK33336.1 hypothetical protein C7419_1049 [Cupriavidus plantarum]REE87727.1 hypothetical protein C7418_5226 [Cupriavidus plantarum]RLK30161.1 hypothetical protein C7417_5264 [Cupriavidus plantarum]CAG2145472.1 hypothetical protein LMG26296_03745 [Cupriavidus plantarum]